MIATDQTIDTMALVEVVNTDQMIDMEEEEAEEEVECIHRHDAILHHDIHHPDIQWTIALAVAVIWAAAIIPKIDIQIRDPIVIQIRMVDIIQWR